MDTCKVAPVLCVKRITSAWRAVMPQLDTRTLFRWVEKGAVPKYVVERANRSKVSNEQARILADIANIANGGGGLLSNRTQEVLVTLEHVPLSRVSVTQCEARHSTVRSLAKDLQRGADLARDDPIVVSFDQDNVRVGAMRFRPFERRYKVIDGHHRFLAYKLQKRRHIRAFVLHLGLADTLRLSWAASTGPHQF